MNEETTSVFVEYFGSSVHIRVLDFLMQGQEFDYSMTEVARGARVGWSAFTKVWQHLLDKKIVTQTRTIGNAKLFTLNKENPIVIKMLYLDREITRAATTELHEGKKATPHSL